MPRKDDIAMTEEEIRNYLREGHTMTLVTNGHRGYPHAVAMFYALDEDGSHAPWDLDLTGPRVFVVGGENGGIPGAVLERCDARVRVPMAGFIPCYNLQAAVSALAIERLRQRGD